MAAILADIGPGDEIIIPSYTFVSSANAFVLRGAKIIFADSLTTNPNIDADQIEKLITSRTKVIVPVHYAGVACDMDKIMALAQKYNLLVIEDAAQGIDSYYKGKPLGSFGHMAAFSFHETKNIISGEGGMLVINDERFEKRAEIIWEKGTNRSAFLRGETNKYGWVDVGSSFLPAEIISAFLYAQLENIDAIQSRRRFVWQSYFESLKELEGAKGVKLPQMPDFATNNGHLFYLICANNEQRNDLISFLKSNGVQAVFHYLSLHASAYYAPKYTGLDLPWCDHYSDCLVRLPLYFELSDEEIGKIVGLIKAFFTE
jgi:dTDP-4-amino-4,6-dideoxygalactose transaminase